MEKILDIIDSIAYDKGLKIEEVEDALIAALIKTAEKMSDSTLKYGASIDKENKKLDLFQKIEIVENNDKRLSGEEVDEYNEIINKDNFMAIKDAKQLDNDLELGDFIQYDMEFDHMGRNAATILYNNFEYKLQHYVSENLFKKYQSKIGTIISSSVTSIDQNDNTFVEIGEVRGIMPRNNRIKGEVFKVGDVIKSVVKSIRIDKQFGLVVEISRTSPKFLEALLELAVPELKDKKITIEASARIPGERAKIALSTNDSTVDPIGSVVGVRGTRINSVSEELNGESIDCIIHSDNKEMFVSRSLSPAIINSIVVSNEQSINEDGYKKDNYKAIVTIGSDQKSRAIGRAGLNIRLAGMLTKCDIQFNEIKSDDANNNNISNSNEEKKDTSTLEALFK